MHCSVIEHGMTSLSFQTAVQKNEAKLSSFVQFEKGNGVISCSITKQSTTCYVLRTYDCESFC